MKQFIQRFRLEHAVLFSIVMALLFIILNRALNRLLFAHSVAEDNYYQSLLQQMITFLLAVFLTAVSGMFRSFCQPKTNFSGSLKVGGFQVALCIFSISGAFFTNNGNKLLPFTEILAFIAFVLLVGAAEELIFRGIVENALLERYGNSYKGIVFAVVLSGIIFGLIHLFNITAGLPVLSVAVQAATAAASGILLSAVYARTRNIFALIFLHGLIDFAGLSESGLWGIGTTESAIASFDLIKLIGVFVYLLPAFYLLRPKKFEDSIKEKNV